MTATLIRHIGYTPKSACDREIKDGSKFDSLFPQPENKKVLEKEDGSIEDTVDLMKQIVDKYSYQTKKIADLLKVKNTDGSINRKETARKVWQFVYDYIKYNYEVGEQLRTPAFTWQCAQVKARKNKSQANSADCDCMAIFCASIFREMKIPFAFRIAGYANSFGFCGGYQHVYAIAYDYDGSQIICDPVTEKFNYEKTPHIKDTIMGSLNGTDIYVLSGLETDTNNNLTIYQENPDGSLGLLAGKAKRKKKKAEKKAKKKAKKQAKKEKKKAKKEIKKAKKAIKKAKKSGDKEALAKAKQAKADAKAKKQEAKEKINANRTGIAKVVSKIGRGIAKFTMKTALAVPRAMFLTLLRMNFRGLAKKLNTNQKAREKFNKVWKKLGGTTKKLDKAINKGKGRKSLFGSKKLKGLLGLQLAELGEVLYENGYFDKEKTQKFLSKHKIPSKNWGKHVVDGTEIEYEKTEVDGLGFIATASIGSAVASAMPIIKKILSVMKEVGENIPETSDEAIEQGWDDVEVEDDSQQITTDDEDLTQEEANTQVDNSVVEQFVETEQEEIEIPVDETESNEDDFIDADAEDAEYEEDEDLEGLCGFGYYEVDDCVNLDGTLGKGLFKNIVSKVGGAVKKVASKVKAKKASKATTPKKQAKAAKKKAKKQAKQEAKATKKQAKQTKKEAKKAVKQAKKEVKKAKKSGDKEAVAKAKQAKADAKTAKKQAKKAVKTTKKETKKAVKTAKKEAKQNYKEAKANNFEDYKQPTELDNSENIEVENEPIEVETATSKGKKQRKGWLKNLINKGKDVKDQVDNLTNNDTEIMNEDEKTQDVPKDNSKGNFIKEHPALSAGIGLLLLGGLTFGAIKLFGGKKDKSNETNENQEKQEFQGIELQ